MTFFLLRRDRGGFFLFVLLQGCSSCGKGEKVMRFSHRVRVHVARSGKRETVVETARGKLRSRVLTRLLGDQYGVVLVVPRGIHVDSVEVVESVKPPPD